MRRTPAAILAALFFCALIGPAPLAEAQELHQDLVSVYRGTVVEVVSETTDPLPGTELITTVQELKILLKEGPRKGEIVDVVNDYAVFKKGSPVYVNYLKTIDGREIISIRDADRTFPLLLFTALFCAAVIYFGGKQGLRALIALIGSILAIIFILVPALLKGVQVEVITFFIGAGILAAAIFMTHGLKRLSVVAYLGTIFSVFFTIILAHIAVVATTLMGFGSDTSVFLNMATFGTIDARGILLSGIIIGVLGVLDDVAVTQAAVVNEIKALHPTLPRKEVFFRAMRVGREHAGALVNTLSFAYAGTALPLLLLFATGDAPLRLILSGENVATEIIRTLVGGMGLILTVPITTYLAVKYLSGSSKEGAHHHHAH